MKEVESKCHTTEDVKTALKKKYTHLSS